MKLETIVDQPVVETERFDLRPLRKSDAGLIALYTSDERVARNTRSIPHPLPPGTAEAFVMRALSQNTDKSVWAMDATKSGGAELMGVIALDQIDRGQSEVGYWVAPAFWNTGIASSALEALMAANPQNSQTLFASVFQDNPASARVLTNAGFAYLGDAEAFCVSRNVTLPTWTYSRKT